MDYRNNDIDRMNMLSPLVWAYIGDAYYEMFVRTYLVNNSNAKPHKLHVEAIKYVSARAQANLLDKINGILTEEELDIVRRGRNTENHHVAKNSNLAEYAKSTAFEALIGYLYLTHKDERLDEILKKCIEEI